MSQDHPRTLAVVPSVLGGELFVRQRGSVRSLERPAGVLQSAIDLRRPERIHLDYLFGLLCGLLFRPDARTVLSFGLGAGTLPSLLDSRLPCVLQDVVESDPAVIDLARRYFHFAPSSRLTLHVHDAFDFLRVVPEWVRWDLLLFDAFSGSAVQDHLVTGTFFRRCAARLGRNGVFALNLHTRSPQCAKIVSAVAGAFEAVWLFEHEYQHHGGLVAARGAMEVGDSELRRRSRESERLLRLERGRLESRARVVRRLDGWDGDGGGRAEPGSVEEP